jgi:rubrerythrin
MAQGEILKVLESNPNEYFTIKRLGEILKQSPNSLSHSAGKLARCSYVVRFRIKDNRSLIPKMAYQFVSEKSKVCQVCGRITTNIARCPKCNTNNLVRFTNGISQTERM